MEVNRDNFVKELPSILEHLLKSSYISFDMEMSGIHKKEYHVGAVNHDEGKPSMQTLYEGIKGAAEKYQVLQFGMTIVEEDREKGFYMARPYNFNISPLHETNSRANFPDRDITFSSSATEFLVNEGFKIAKVFASGCFYLSTAEENETAVRFHARELEKTKFAPVVVDSKDIEMVQFVRQIRKACSSFENNPKVGYVNIEDARGALSGHQRRMVYQVIENEFPGLRTYGMNDTSFMQVKTRNKEADARAKREREKKQEEAVANQIGLRWIFEAITNGDLDGMPATWFNVSDENKSPAATHSFETLKEKLKHKQFVAVGHNLFTDLVYLVKTFVGTLPATVTEFTARAHHLFPMIYDTKYVATIDAVSSSPLMRKSLQQLHEPMSKIHKPIILLHERHAAYCGSIGRGHEAGYDSWMTMELFIKLTAQLACAASNAKADTESTSGSFGPYVANVEEETLISFATEDDVKEDVVLAEQIVPPVSQWLPPMYHVFWSIYTNKLRVNASKDEVWELQGKVY